MATFFGFPFIPSCFYTGYCFLKGVNRFTRSLKLFRISRLFHYLVIKVPLPVFSPGDFCCLAKQLLYITTPLSLCQQLFSFFSISFFFCLFLYFFDSLSCESFASIPRPVLFVNYFFQFFYFSKITASIFSLVKFMERRIHIPAPLFTGITCQDPRPCPSADYYYRENSKTRCRLPVSSGCSPPPSSQVLSG